MARPRDIGVIDTLIGFRDVRHVRDMPAVRDGWERHPAEYMFKDIPVELKTEVYPMSAIDETGAESSCNLPAAAKPADAARRE